MNRPVPSEPQNSADASAHLAAFDPLDFAIAALRQRAVRITELQAEIKRLKATIARLRKA